MADTTSYENKYRKYLEDEADTFLKPERPDGDKLIMGGIAAVGLAAGGVLAFKSGLMKDMIGGAIRKAGEYRRGRIVGANTSLRRWSEEEDLGNLMQGFKEIATGKFSQGGESIKSFVEAAKRFGEHQQNGEVEHIQRMAGLMGKQLRDNEFDAQLRFSQRDARVKQLQDSGMVSDDALVEARKLMDKDIYEQGLIDPKESMIKLKQSGYRFATVQDLVDAKEININDGFVQDGMRIYEELGHDRMDFLKSKADDFILINEANDIADLRDFRQTFSGAIYSATTDFTIPLIKINPLRMFYLDQFYNPKNKPFYHVADPTTRNPTINGHNGANGIPYLFVNGNVYDPTKLNAKGTLDTIAENVYLVDAKSGPIARLDRNMAGISISTFDPPPANAPLLDRLKYGVAEILDIGLQDEPPGQFDLLDMTSWGTAVMNKITAPLRMNKYQKRENYLRDSHGRNSDYFYFRKMKTWEESTSVKDFFTQFTAGRKGINETDKGKDITTASLFAYGFMERLNATLNQVGMGLSTKHLGSAFDIFAGLTLYRVAPIWAGVELWDYMNYESENLLGVQMSDKLATMYADTSVELARLRDAVGITDWAKDAANIFVGGEQLADFPVVGRLLDLNDSEEETREYWQEGEDEVRKGRWWSLGNTPFTGGKVDRYEPNWVRRVLSDYEYTDTMYGSREEYFENSWMPTVRNPLAPIRHFVTDPYHYEEKHYQDRPYPVTGGIPELENFPLIGPLLNATVGRILKPQRTMHEGEWGGSQPPLQYAVPSFEGDVPMEAMPATVGTSYGSGVIAGGGGNMEQKKASAKALAIYVTSSGDVQLLNTADKANIWRAQQNIAGSSPARSGIFQQERLPDTGYEEEQLPADYTMTPMDWQQTVGNLHYNMSEMGGFYGFMGMSATGEMVKNAPVLQSSSDMTSYSRAFWDMDIGGYGGDANEIFRRFLPKDRKLNEVNPIANTMPDWLPGSSYFVNFQQGDPYVKIKKGEMRLPGTAYESLYGIDSEKLMKLDIGASFIGYDMKTIREHMLKEDAIKDDYFQEILDKGTDWHKAWEKEMAKTGVAESMEQYVKDDASGIGGFYDLYGKNEKVLKWLTDNAVEFKYYEAADGSGTDDEQHGFYNKPIDILSLPEDQRGAFLKALGDASEYALIDPKTRGEKAWTNDNMHFENVQQVNFYANQMKTDINYLIHVDRDDPKKGIKVFAFERNEDLLAYTKAKVEAVRQGIRNDIDSGKLHRGNLYDPIDRYRILADVAPYSQEFRNMKEQLSNINFNEHEKKEIEEINRQVGMRKDRLRLYPYRFKTANVDNDLVTVDRVIDTNTFIAKEFPDNPIRLAGLSASVAKDNPNAEAAAKEVGRVIKEGAKVKIAYDHDEMNRVKKDTYRTIQAVVYDGQNRNINKRLIDSGVVKEKTNDYSPAAIHARFTPGEIRLGATWEQFAHADTILHTKFLQVRSPLESYERREVYGKDWQEWNDPIDDFLIPAVQNAMNHHPVLAVAGGALFGAAFGSLKSADVGGEKVMARYGKIVGGAIGATVMGAAVMYRVLQEHINGGAWIPERRKKERAVEEYFDVLEYVKYDALFKKYADEALKKEGFNVEKYVESKKFEGEQRKLRMEELDEFKRKLYVTKPGQWEKILDELADKGIKATDRQAALKMINAEINQLKTHREIRPVTPLAAKALLYQQARNTTMYGYEAGDPIANVLASLPKKEREYLVPFTEAPEEDRKRILDLVPSYVRRVLQSSYGEKVDEKKSLREFFQNRPLPGAGWAGWREDTSLEDLKFKFIDRVGMDPSEFDMWEDDAARVKNMPVATPNVFGGGETNASYYDKIRDILSGAGLDGVRLDIVDSDVEGVQVQLEIERNRQQDFKDLLNKEGGNVM